MFMRAQGAKVEVEDLQKDCHQLANFNGSGEGEEEKKSNDN